MFSLLFIFLLSSNPGSEPVAKVAGRTIYKEEIPKNTPVEVYIKRLVFFEIAKEKGYDDSVRAIVERSFDETLVRELYSRIIRDSKPTLAESFIMYRLLGKEVKAQLIQTEDFMTAYHAWLEVIKGNDFGEVSTKYSAEVRLKNQKGDIGWLRWRYDASPLLKKAFRMKEGEISFPFKSNEGWLIIKVLEIKDRELQDFINMESGLKSQIKRIKSDKIANDHINYLKWILDIDIDIEGLRLLSSRVPIPSERARGGLRPEFKLEDMDVVLGRSNLGLYTMRDFSRDIKTIRRLPQLRNREEAKNFTEWRIVFHFLVLEAKRLGIHRLPEISENFMKELSRMAIRRWKAYEIEPLVKVTDEDRINYYEVNKEKYRMLEKRKVYLIEVETKEDIDEIKRELQRGKDFEKLATEKSIGEGQNRGGLIGFINKDERGVIGEEAFELNVGKVSEPFKKDDRWAIIKITDIKESYIPLYSEIRYRLNRDYEGDKRREIEDKIFEENKEKFGVEILISGEFEEEFEALDVGPDKKIERIK